MFEKVKLALKEKQLITTPEMFSELAAFYSTNVSRPFEFIIVDEAQDVSIAQLRFLAVLGKGYPNSLFFAGDLGQRIFEQPFLWRSLGVDVRGASHNAEDQLSKFAPNQNESRQTLGAGDGGRGRDCRTAQVHDFCLQRATADNSNS